MPNVERIDSIERLDRNAWNACFPQALEDYDYLLATERSQLQGFRLAYYVITEGDRFLAGMPAFFTDYNLATTAEGWVKTVLQTFPKLCTIKLACFGSPVTETCMVAMHPQANDQQKRGYFQQLLDGFHHDAPASLLGFKDVNAEHKALFGDLLSEAGYHSITGMQSAVSAVDFATIDAYLARLSPATRKDMRRKLKKREGIRLEYRRNIDDCLSEVYSMYLDTKRRSDLQFEELTPDYFRHVLACEQSLCALYYAGDTLIGANLLLVNHERLLDKFFCMNSIAGQQANLYFVSWFANLQLCLDRGLRCYQSGQAGMEIKLRLGCTPEPSWMLFKHRNRVIGTMLKAAAPYLAFDA